MSKACAPHIVSVRACNAIRSNVINYIERDYFREELWLSSNAVLRMVTRERSRVWMWILTCPFRRSCIEGTRIAEHKLTREKTSCAVIPLRTLWAYYPSLPQRRARPSTKRYKNACIFVALDRTFGRVVPILVSFAHGPANTMPRQQLPCNARASGHPFGWASI